MKPIDPTHESRIAELRARLEQLDAERTAVAAEIHRLTDPAALQGPPPGVQEDPIAGSAQKDWHVFAGAPKSTPPKAP